MSELEYRYYTVWDPLLRGLHWWNALTLLALVALGTAGLFLGDALEEPLYDTLTYTHALLGYLFGAGLLARLLWLFVGPREARLGDLLPIGRSGRNLFFATIRYYFSLLRGTPPIYKAHNTFAGVIYVAFFVVASIQVFSGVTMHNSVDEAGGQEAVYSPAEIELALPEYDEEETSRHTQNDDNNNGHREHDHGDSGSKDTMETKGEAEPPAAEEQTFQPTPAVTSHGSHSHDEGEETILEELHEFGYWFIMFFVLAHVFAVFVHELVEPRGLISAMVHGRKTFTKEEWRELDK